MSTTLFLKLQQKTTIQNLNLFCFFSFHYTLELFKYGKSNKLRQLLTPFGSTYMFIE